MNTFTKNTTWNEDKDIMIKILDKIQFENHRTSGEKKNYIF